MRQFSGVTPRVAGKLSVHLENRLDELQRVDTAIEEFAEQLDLPFSVVFQLRLVVEELFMNVVNYAYDDAATHEILITVECSDEQVELHIVDDGKAFDPLTIDYAVKEDEKLEEMEIGGKGWTLIRAYMDDIEYAYEDGKNHLKLVKTLT